MGLASEARSLPHEGWPTNGVTLYLILGLTLFLVPHFRDHLWGSLVCRPTEPALASPSLVPSLYSVYKKKNPGKKGKSGRTGWEGETEPGGGGRGENGRLGGTIGLKPMVPPIP